MSRAFRAEVPRIPVPERLTRPHSAVKALRSENRPSVSRAAKSRALRLLQGIAAECDRRGYPVVNGSDNSALTITINGHSCDLLVREQDDRIPHTPFRVGETRGGEVLVGTHTEVRLSAVGSPHIRA
jgi:hypothetical protein